MNKKSCTQKQIEMMRNYISRKNLKKVCDSIIRERRINIEKTKKENRIEN